MSTSIEASSRKIMLTSSPDYPRELVLKLVDTTLFAFLYPDRRTSIATLASASADMTQCYVERATNSVWIHHACFELSATEAQRVVLELGVAQR